MRAAAARELTILRISLSRGCAVQQRPTALVMAGPVLSDGCARPWGRGPRCLALCGPGVRLYRGYERALAESDRLHIRSSWAL